MSLPIVVLKRASLKQYAKPLFTNLIGSSLWKFVVSLSVVYYQIQDKHYLFDNNCSIINSIFWSDWFNCAPGWW